MRRFGGMTRPERFAASTQQVSPLPIPLPLQNEVVDERRLLTVPWVSLFQWILNIGTRIYLEGTHADRIDEKNDPAQYRPGTWFYETDRTVLYQVRIVDVAAVPPTSPPTFTQEPRWVYVAGTMRGLAVTNKPTDLGAYDTGFLFYAADYAHTWRWTGSTWQYAPGDRASGEIAWFTVDPGTGWALCNGTSTFRTLGNATTSAITTPNLITAYAKGAAAYSPAVVPASGSVSGGTTDPESGHTHSIAHDHPSFASGDGAVGASPATTGANFYASIYTHTHTIDVPAYSGASGAGSAHSHTLGALSITAVEPKHVDLMPYLRQ
jgi:hypothetical protein